MNKLIKKKVSKGYLVLRKRKREKKLGERKLERDWWTAVDQRANYVCEKCGTNTNLEHHHVFGKRYKSIRFDVDNGVLLCIRHHVPWAHTQVVAFQEWIIERRGIAWWNRLVEKKNRGQGIGCIS